MTNLYPHLTPYVRPRDYMGATYPETFEVYGIHRDSDSVSRSNWAVLERDYGDAPGVFITRASHWAVGWVDTLRVDPKEASPDTLKALDDALARLEDYPVLDEDHLSALEWDEACAYWESMSTSERVYACQRARVSIFAARSATLPPDDSGYLLDYLRG